MRAFLSHSSKDKGFVEAAAELLRPGTYELDSATFDAGIINAEAITIALRCCDLFCLFLSANSVQSSYVDFETMLGGDFLASGKIGKFITICLDDSAFALAAANVKFYNIVRKSLDSASVARLIQGQLISAAERSSSYAHPFSGRDDELLELESQVTNHRRPPSKAIYISGNFGSGRRTLAQKFYERRYPHVGRMPPSVNLDAFTGIDELYRKTIAALRPAATVSEIKTRIQAFGIASADEKRLLVAQLFNSLLPVREVAHLIDTGGVLMDSGALVPELNDVINHVETKPHPPLVIIAPRMVPLKLRRAEDDISYIAAKSLPRDVSKRLLSGLLRDKSVSVSDSQLDELIKLGDGHPFNIYRLIEEVFERGIEPFLANPTLFIDWKHRQSSEYLSKTAFSDNETKILGLLKQLPELDFAAIVSSLSLDAAAASDDLLRLSNLHVVEATSGVFSVSPALRVAVERDRRMRLSTAIEREAMRSLAQSLVVRLEEGTAPITLVDSAVLSSLESGQALSSLASAFLLPSHSVWLAKRHYDQRHWADSIRFSSEALKSANRLSSQGYVSACRFMCLSAARLGEATVFEDGINKLRSVAKDDWARSNVAFLTGFNLRLIGHLPEAEAAFRQSYQLSPGNISAAREIASICLARDNLDEAGRFAREALSHAPTNPYLLDIMISVLVRQHGRSAKHSSEINAMFDTLEAVGEEGGRSFFTTRKAEFEHLWGDNKLALKLIEDAVAKTPTIFEPRRLCAEIYLKDGNKNKALEVLGKMQEMVNSRDPNERRTNYRSYLKTYSHYLVEIERYQEAKDIYDDAAIFTTDERNAAVKEIEIVQGFKQTK